MTESEMDERISLLRYRLRNQWEKLLPQVTRRAAKAQSKAQKVKTDEAWAVYTVSMTELRAYLRSCSQQIVYEFDRFIREVPCTRYSRICYMDVLTGEPLAWGTPFDLNMRANELCSFITQDAWEPDSKRQALVDKLGQALEDRNTAEAEKARTKLRELANLEKDKEDLLKRPLLTELLRVLQHMDDARSQWEKAPVRSMNFQDHLGSNHFPKVEAVMVELGIVPTAGKGKGKVIAALHAACDHFQRGVPQAGQWPGMLSATFPGTEWSAKCKAELRSRYRIKSYKEAYQAVRDRLG